MMALIKNKDEVARFHCIDQQLFLAGLFAKERLYRESAENLFSPTVKFYSIKQSSLGK
ncbi:hypothetical protein [Coxiella endosymbiont of Ornithodoros amblus]|uniref:hypothetical protein n=1 Tax=Coxiella endosymbiont of Ornithodoros amblus TaxID=1656166 RepID=UPI00244D9DB9|nr:hypothetical protein [Coxiella endosymbiont of Ornithodoros amblus]